MLYDRVILHASNDPNIDIITDGLKPATGPNQNWTIEFKQQGYDFLIKSFHKERQSTFDTKREQNCAPDRLKQIIDYFSITTLMTNPERLGPRN